MFSGTHSSKPSKFITVHLSPEKDNFSACPTPPPQKISLFSRNVEYLFSHFNWPCLSSCTTVGCVPKNNNFCKQPVLPHDLVELWHAFLHPCSIGPLTAVGREIYQFVARMLLRYSCSHDPLALCSLWYNSSLPWKLSFLCPIYVWTRKRTTSITTSTSTGDTIHYPCQVMYPTLDNPVTSNPNMTQPSHQ